MMQSKTTKRSINSESISTIGGIRNRKTDTTRSHRKVRNNDKKGLLRPVIITIKRQVGSKIAVVKLKTTLDPCKKFTEENEKTQK